MRLINKLRQNRGFTMAELLMAMAIFGIISIAFLSLFSGAYYLTIRAGNRDNAVADSSSKIENSIVSSSYPDATITDAPAGSVTITFDTNPAPVAIDAEIITGTTTMSGAGTPDETTTVTYQYYRTKGG